MAPGDARYTALLTPQGKIVADFFVVAAPESERRLLYRLPGGACGRAVPEAHLLPAAREGDDREDRSGVLAIWGGDGNTARGLFYRDPRLPGLGSRALILPAAAKDAVAELGATLVDANEYDAHRIALGVPKGSVDFVYADAFPHDADLDKLHGVDFKKGCFVGQEVVSRVEHRGTARNRIVPVSFDGAAPPAGTSVMAGEKSVGIMGSSAGKIGLAMLRVDRVAEALSAGTKLIAGGTSIILRESAFGSFLKTERAEDA